MKRRDGKAASGPGAYLTIARGFDGILGAAVLAGE